MSSPEEIIELKCENPWFSDVYEGKKNFEVRVDDRPYAPGVVVDLREYDRTGNTYSGRSVRVHIDYVLRDNRFVPEGSCIFGFTRISSSAGKIPVTVHFKPDVYRTLADIASSNTCSVPDVVRMFVSSCVEKRMRMPSSPKDL